MNKRVRKVPSVVRPDKAGNLQVAVQFDYSPDSVVHYVNHAEIGNTQHEFSIVAARVPTKFSGEQLNEIQTKGRLTLSPDVQLILPPTLLPRLIDALTTQLEKYEALYGKIKTDERKK